VARNPKRASTKRRTPRTKKKYCEEYGPCANSVVKETDVYAPEFNCQVKRSGKVPETCQDKKKKLKIQTHYECRWGEGQMGVGCQNVEATSSSGGNNVRCDQGCVEMTDLVELRVDEKVLAKFGIGGRNSQGSQSTARKGAKECLPNTACYACRPCDITGFNETTLQVKRVFNKASEDAGCSFVKAGNHDVYGDCKQCTTDSPCWGPLYGAGGGSSPAGL